MNWNFENRHIISKKLRAKNVCQLFRLLFHKLFPVISLEVRFVIFCCSNPSSILHNLPSHHIRTMGCFRVGHQLIFCQDSGIQHNMDNSHSSNMVCFQHQLQVRSQQHVACGPTSSLHNHHSHDTRTMDCFQVRHQLIFCQ